MQLHVPDPGRVGLSGLELGLGISKALLGGSAAPWSSRLDILPPSLLFTHLKNKDGTVTLLQ